jgi:tetratricopeptide (TPR) repeat protein
LIIVGWAYISLSLGVGQLSLCCENLGDIQRAKELASEALSIATCCLPNDHPRIAFCELVVKRSLSVALQCMFVVSILDISQLPNCHGRAGRTDEAIVGIEQSIDIRKKNLPSTRSDLSASLNKLGLLYHKKGMLEEARKTFEECLSIDKSIVPPQHPDIGTSLYNLGCTYKANDIVRATETLKECLAIRENCLPRHIQVL